MQVVIAEPLVYLFEQFGRGLQIDVRGTDIYMTHIGGKSGQPGVDIVSLPVPGKQPVYGEGMPLMPSSRLCRVAYQSTVCIPAFLGENHKLMLDCSA